MTGLEKIIQAIEAEAEAGAKVILDQAKGEAEDILKTAKAQAELKCAEIANKSELEIKSVLSRAESGARLQERKLILEEKQQVIGEILSKAMNKLVNLPEAEYFNVILKIIKNHAHPQSGQIVFSMKDRTRLPKDFSQAIDEVLAGLPGAKLSVADTTAEIDGGFILVYGEIEENCSFEALFLVAKDELQDKVNAFLYE